MIAIPRRRLSRAGGALVALLLASCLHTPPSVTPSAKLVPSADEEAGPRTGSAFAVAYAAPRGEVHDRSDPAITVLFNRSMRSLDTPEGEGLPRIDVRTKEGAAVAGRLRWVGTRGLIFVPDAPLPGASHFVVTVPAETKALDGAPLGSAYAFELSTPRPAVVRTFPSRGATSLKPDAPWTVTLNQDVAPEALAQAVRMVAHRNDGDPGEVVAFHVERAPVPARPANARAPLAGWLEGKIEHSYFIKPDKPMPHDAGIELTIAAGLRGAEGPMTMEKPFSLQARTFGPLKLTSFHCARIVTEGRCKAHNDVHVTLSNPVAPDELKRHLKAPGLLAKVDPKAKPKRAPETSSLHWIGADPQPGRKYKVTLTAGMKDVFGQALAEDATFEIESEPPFSGAPPAAAKVAKGKKPAPPPPEPRRTAEAPKPVAGVAHRAILAYELDLGISGSVLEALATTGNRTHKLPVSSVNVPTYQLAAMGLTEPQMLAWLGEKNLSDFLARNHVDESFVTPGTGESTRAVKTVDLDALLGKAGRGAAFVVARVPGEGRLRQQVVRVTDLGVTAKASRTGSLVWVTSLATGKPVAGATVSLRTPEKGEVYASRTDDQGMTEIPADRLDPFGEGKEKDSPRVKPPVFLFVHAGDDWTYEPLVRSATEQRVASGFQDFSTRGETLGMMYTDRGVYRPGETAKVSGLFRTITPGGMRAAVAEEVRLEAYDGNGETVFSTRVPIDKFGGFTADVKVPKSAHLGDARVTATVRGRNVSAETTETFRLAAYKASEFKVEATAGAKEYVRGDDAAFDLKAEYLFGGPMVGVSAHTTITRTIASFTPPGADGFVTTDEARIADEQEVNARSSDLGASDEKLDQEGKAGRRLRLAMPGQRLPERVTFEAEVEDLSRQTVAERASALVHPAEFYVALGALKERFVTAGGQLHATALAIEPSGARRAGVPVKVELFSRKWVAAVEEHGDGGAHRSARLKDELVGSCEIHTAAAEARGCDVKVPDAGYFVLRASAKDPRGNDSVASLTFYGVEDTPSPSAPSIAWADGDTRSVKIEPNKKTYDVGETARILVQSPFREAEALVTVERNGVMMRKAVHVAGPMPVVDVPVTAEMYPNAYVSVHLVRGRVGAPPEKGADLSAPEFRLGYAELDVNPDAHRLAVTVTPDRKDHKPGEEIDVDLAVADRGGRPVSSELTFYAVDEGVLMLTGYKTPDPVPAFARRRPLSVFTVESRESLAQIVPYKAGERVSILGYEYASRGDKGEPGGGGGPGGMRADFRTTAYFEAGKVTNAEGKARIHFKLPDNLTTFRLMAVAADQGDFFGAGEAKVTTSKKLMARPALPRIVRVGDAFEASVLLSSKDLDDADVDVSLATTGLELKGAPAQRVHLAKGGTAEVRFPVVASVPGEVKLELTARGGGETDSVRATRTAVLPVSAEIAAAYGETTDAAAVALGDVSHVRPDQGELRLRAAPTALVGLSTSLESLVEYPYGCTEQLSSHLLPLAVLTDLAKDYGAHLPANVPHAIEEAVDAIIKNQRDDGGFGFWEDSAESEPWLSAYVILTLDAVKKAGNAVPASALDGGVSYLREVLRRTKLSDAEPEPESRDDATPVNRAPGVLSPDQEMTLGYANAAFVADALATIGAPDPGMLTRLYDARKSKPLGARALLLHAMTAAKGSQDLVASLSKEIEADLRVDANEAAARYDDDDVGRAIFDSPARSTALALRGLLAADKHHPLAPRLARGLLGMREKGAWRSTQENGWALLALRDYRAAQETSKREIEARAFLGSEMVGSRTFEGTADAELVATVPAARVLALGGPAAFEVVGEGKLFYAAELRYATTALPRVERDRGLFVKKLVRGLKPEELADASTWIPAKSADGAEAGSLVLVDLLLESSEARRQVVIDDPLPSGVEPVETALDTASKSRQVKDDTGDEGSDAKRPGALTGLGAAFRSARVHREMHDDRVLTFIEDLPPGMYHFRYLGRATSIGRFVVPPTRVEAMYSPEIWGSTAAGTFEVVAKK
jgi:uncharacterized protein YfaS (alpha-2-macroglobulin family)